MSELPLPREQPDRGRDQVLDVAPLGISVHDHIIVGKNGHASLKGMRLI